MINNRYKVALFLLLILAATGCAEREQIKKHVGPGGSYALDRQAHGKLKKTRAYTIAGITYYPIESAYGFSQTGVASWYGPDFHGKQTANGERYDMHAMTCAHKTLPMNTMLEVSNLENGRKIVVRVNDRGPFVGNRIIDLSKAGATKIGMISKGTARVRLVALAQGSTKKAEIERGDDEEVTAENIEDVPVPAKPIPDFNKGEFYVQVGAFASRSNAEKLRERLMYPIEKIILFDMPTDDGKKLIRIRIGPYPNMAQAQEALKGAKSDGFASAYIVAP